MTKKTKILLYSSITALLVGLSIWYWFIRKPIQDALKDPSKYDANKPLLWIGCNDNFPIVMGSCGQRVKELQKYFNKKLTAAGKTEIQLAKIFVSIPIKEDGKFGKKTYAAATKVIGFINWLAPTGNNMNEEKYNFWSQYF